MIDHICPICGEDYENYDSCQHFSRDFIPAINEARRVARLWFRRAQATEEKLKIAIDALESIQHGVIASCDHAANERILMRAASEALQQIGGEK